MSVGLTPLQLETRCWEQNYLEIVWDGVFAVSVGLTPLQLKTRCWEQKSLKIVLDSVCGVSRVNAFTTGNPLLGTKLLGNSVG